jgi:CheY-like chemotaxis protein
MKTVLVVDDEYTMVETLTEVLGAEGYRVLQASDSRDALRKLAIETPDLVLLDYMMPVLDGMRTLEAIRADERLAPLPVIFMSAAMPDDLQASAPGWTLFLPKPFTVTRLCDALRTALAAS